MIKPRKEESRLLCGRVRESDLDWLSRFLLVSLRFVQIYAGYFIHYFAPRGLPPVERNVVFVIDVGGSMFGIKMKQVTRTFGTFHNSFSRRLRKQKVLKQWFPGARDHHPWIL